MFASLIKSMNERAIRFVGGYVYLIPGNVGNPFFFNSFSIDFKKNIFAKISWFN